MQDNFAYLNTLGFASIVVDRRGIVVFATQKALEIFNYSAVELVGQFVEILVPSVFHEKHLRLRDEFIADPSERQMAGRVLSAQRRNGDIVRVEIGLSPVSGGNYVIAGISRAGELASAEILSQSRQAAEVFRNPNVFIATQLSELRREQLEFRSKAVFDNPALMTPVQFRQQIREALREELAEFGIDVSTAAARAEFIINIGLVTSAAKIAKTFAMRVGWIVILAVIALIVAVAIKAKML